MSSRTPYQTIVMGGHEFRSRIETLVEEREMEVFKASRELVRKISNQRDLLRESREFIASWIRGEVAPCRKAQVTELLNFLERIDKEIEVVPPPVIEKEEILEDEHTIVL
jgi:hypothetical protein